MMAVVLSTNTTMVYQKKHNHGFHYKQYGKSSEPRHLLIGKELQDMQRKVKVLSYGPVKNHSFNIDAFNAEWLLKGYNMLTRNCRFYTTALIKALV